ncbi:hypothetical protein Tco_0015386 [Tanacetum coccineum]
MLDSYTSSMCNDSCGRSSFARCLIEVNSEADLVDDVTIGIPSLSEWMILPRRNIRVEYDMEVRPDVISYMSIKWDPSAQRGTTYVGYYISIDTFMLKIDWLIHLRKIISPWSNSFSDLNEEGRRSVDVKNVDKLVVSTVVRVYGMS